LLQEIIAYTNNKLGGEDKYLEVQIREDDGFITFYAYEEGKVIIEKRMMFLINKYDLVNDKDILKEYQEQLYNQILDFFKKNKI
jgi:hypothetical protein